MSLRVLSAGLLSTLQDEGRFAKRRLGIGQAGAFDQPALHLANALCGNPANACALEITLVGPTLLFEQDSLIAVTGAPFALFIDDQPAPLWSPLRVNAGSCVRLTRPHVGCRAYLAVHGGMDVPVVLGSRSTDLNAALGPLQGRALQKGDHIPLHLLPPMSASALSWSLNPAYWFSPPSQQPLRLLSGTHREQLDATSLQRLFSGIFTVSTDSNRTGVRLEGEKLVRKQHTEMLSEGALPGAVQLPPSGQPIIFGPEGPVSGGYPRIGQIAAVDFPRLAHYRPGDRVCFVPCQMEEALLALQQRDAVLQRLIRHIALRLHQETGLPIPCTR